MIWNFNQRFSFLKNNFKKERSVKGLRQLEREIVQIKPRQILYNSLATIRPSKETFVYFRLIYSLTKRFHHRKLDVANIKSCKDLNSEVIDHVFACCEFEWSIDRTHSPSMLGNCLNNDRSGYRLRYLNFILQKQWKSTVNQEKEALL